MLEFSIKKSYATFSLDASLAIDREVMVLLAPSGGGKTLTLNLVSGIIQPDSGRIVLNGKTLYDDTRGIFVPTRKRRIGYIFQDYALFPHKTVAENIAFGIADRSRAAAVTTELMERFQLTDKGDVYPEQLSGGQRQRAAIARGLAAQPRAMLYDEPLSALDTHLRESLLREIRETARQIALPVIYVTHNFHEAVKIGDRIAVMDAGTIIEQGPAAEIFRRPVRLFTARFTGAQNIFPGEIVSRNAEFLRIKIFDRFLLDVHSPPAVPESHRIWMGINPNDVRLVVTSESRPNVVAALVEAMEMIGYTYRIILQIVEGDKPVPGFRLYMDIEELTCKKYQLHLRAPVSVSLRPERIFLCY